MGIKLKKWKNALLIEVKRLNRDDIVTYYHKNTKTLHTKAKSEC